MTVVRGGPALAFRVGCLWRDMSNRRFTVFADLRINHNGCPSIVAVMPLRCRNDFILTRDGCSFKKLMRDDHIVSEEMSD